MNAPSKTEVEAPYVLREDKDGVATVTLNRGDRMNPLSTAMLSALQTELDRVAKDADTKVVVLAGAGKHFCAGHDLREMRSHPDKVWQKVLFEQCSEVMLSLVRLPQPVIARVQGVAVAAGCQLVSMCDLAVASEVAQFALPGIKSGIFCTTPGVGVARNLARKHTLEMLFTGDLIDAKTALSWGLVNRVAPLAGLDAEVDKLARKIVAHSSAVVSMGKRFFYDQVEKGLADAYSLASEGMACNMMLEEQARLARALDDTRRLTCRRRNRGPVAWHSTQQWPIAALFAPRWAKPGRGERRLRRLRARWWKGHGLRARRCSTCSAPSRYFRRDLRRANRFSGSPRLCRESPIGLPGPQCLQTVSPHCAAGRLRPRCRSPVSQRMQSGGNSSTRRPSPRPCGAPSAMRAPSQQRASPSTCWGRARAPMRMPTAIFGALWTRSAPWGGRSARAPQFGANASKFP